MANKDSVSNKLLAPDWLFDGTSLINAKVKRVVVSVVYNANSFSDRNLQTSSPQTSNSQIKDVIYSASDELLANATSLNGILSPALIDLQVNGGGGILLNHQPTVEGVQRILTAHQKLGTHFILPTLITDNIDVMAKAADAVSAFLKLDNKASSGVMGIHFEGPHLSQPKKGVHPSTYIRGMSDEERAIYARDDIGIKLVTIAPETVLKEDMEFLVKQNCIISIGHTNAPYQDHIRTLEQGARGFTHLFNAMSAFTGREPGAVGAALNVESAYAGIILDGYHVDYASAKLAWNIKNKLPDSKRKQGRLYLVSDAMASIGSELNSFSLFDQTVRVKKGRLTNEDGTLAGAHLCLLKAVQNAHQYLGLNIESALKMATAYPAQFIKEDDKLGVIKKGANGDLILLDEKLNLVQSSF